jgi:FdrA protein
MGLRYEIRKNTYFDSVTLMLISKDISKLDGVVEAIVGMGTDLNKELAERLKVSNEEIKEIGANDFFIAAMLSDDMVWEDAVGKLDELLNKKSSNDSMDYRPKTLKSAIDYQPDSNIAVISVPGKYAADEAKKALQEGLHVMLFSDNVSIESEKELKELAFEKELLMMGPDCGTAIINNVPLAFANVIRQGDIGIVGASGTGTQEVSVIIDKLGKGVSQVIGTGGRDLKSEIGGLTMMTAFKSLVEDEATKVIVLISKPPAEDVSQKILELASKSPKPVVVDFIGGDYEKIKSYGVYPSVSLEDAARKAVSLSDGQTPKDFGGFSMDEAEIEKQIKAEVEKMDGKQRYIRGLYTGGTLADEAMKAFGNDLGGIYSNIPLDPKFKLEDSSRSIGHTCIDLGDDEFTKGRPHPMIDPSTRSDRLIREAEDESIAVVLMDFVLGYGSHADPAGEMIESIKFAKDKAIERGQYLSIVGSICGTDKDPQSLDASQKLLEDNGVIIFPSNSQAVRFVKRMIENIQSRRS